mmetsp:Transcript_30021/g.47933  ORF Transcript_30021/g.47933 Transcript_30021/m.47933 type:complete len:267 (+) Transcript_30021:132-932(+)
MAQEQILIQLQPTQQIEAQLLMTQIDSLFQTFEAAVKYKKSGKADHDGLVTLNDTAVSQLNLFGKQCDQFKKKGAGTETDILRAAYAYYLQQKAKQLSSWKQQDVADVGSWLLYMEASMASPQASKKLKISQQTVSFAEKALLGALPKMVGSAFAQNHETHKIAQDVQSNAVKYQQRNDAWRKQTKSEYDTAQRRARCPAQNDMYNYTGGGAANAKLRFVSASEKFGKGAVNKHFMDIMDQDGKEQDEEQDVDVDVDVNGNTGYDE